MSTAGNAAGVIIFTVVINILAYLYNANNFFTRRCCAWRRTFFTTNRAEPLPTLATHNGQAPFVHGNGLGQAPYGPGLAQVPANQWATEPALRKYPTTFWAFDLLDPSFGFTGALGRWGLLLLRLLMVVVFVFTIVWEQVGSLPKSSGPEHPPAYWLIYFTNWSFCGFGLTSLLGFFLSLKAVLRGNPPRPGRWTWVESFHHLAFITVCCNEVTLSIAYWAAIRDPKGGHVYLDDVLRHGVSAVLLLLELMLSRIPVASYHFEPVLGWMSMYTVFFWIWYWVNHEWIYRVLRWGRSSVGGYYVALVVILLIIYALMYGLAQLREVMARRAICCACCRPGARQQRHQQQAQEARQKPYVQQDAPTVQMVAIAG